MDFGFELNLDGTSDDIAPGEFRMCTLSFWAVKEWPIIVPGERFEIREGTRVVGYGTIVDLPQKT